MDESRIQGKGDLRMKQIVFYSWQSDLPNSCNRGFIQNALENAAASIKADDTVEVEPVVDRDTQGVPGAPDIASTIFAKITAADVFVADVSITGKDERRATPNPNVLIELGYALKALGHERVILVFNRAFGKIEDLPFDLRMRRVLAYDMLEKAERGAERKNLEKQLEGAIRAALEKTPRHIDTPSIPAVPAIEGQQANRIIVLRRNLQDILRKLDILQPKKYSEGGTVDELIGGLAKTQEVIAEFSKIAAVISVMNDTDAALEAHRWFGLVYERYDLPEKFSGRFSNADYDYFKFLGHELYVTFVGFLLKEQRWSILGEVLSEPIPVRYYHPERGPANVDWWYAAEHLPSLMDESSRKGRMCLHADILNERHTTGGLAATMPMAEFVAADYFLFLLREMLPEDAPTSFFDWRPWSTLYLDHSPMFLRNAEYKRSLEQIMKLFHISSIEEFRKRLMERGPLLRRLFDRGFWRYPIRTEDIEKIGTR
jgi:hypothetical protein